MVVKYFTREDTKVLKGLAIILMLLFHLWAFPDRIVGEGVKTFLLPPSLIVYIGKMGHICVPMFLFLGGYGTYKIYEGGNFSITKRLLKVYFSYWKIFCIFVPIGYIFCSNQPIYCSDYNICTRFLEFDFKRLLLNLLGLFKNTQAFNSEWWFLFLYAMYILTFPIVIKIIHLNNKYLNCFILLIFTIIAKVLAINNCFGINLDYVYLYVIYFPVFYIGSLMAYNNRFEFYVKKYINQSLSKILDLIFLTLILVFRTYILHENFDFITIPIFCVISCDFFIQKRIIRGILIKFGQHSTTIWLTHTFYCYYFYIFAKIIIAPQYAISTFIWFLFVSLFTAMIIDRIYLYMNKRIGYLLHN